MLYNLLYNDINVNNGTYVLFCNYQLQPDLLNVIDKYICTYKIVSILTLLRS